MAVEEGNRQQFREGERERERERIRRLILHEWLAEGATPLTPQVAPPGASNPPLPPSFGGPTPLVPQVGDPNAPAVDPNADPMAPGIDEPPRFNFRPFHPQQAPNPSFGPRDSEIVRDPSAIPDSLPPGIDMPSSGGFRPDPGIGRDPYGPGGPYGPPGSLDPRIQALLRRLRQNSQQV